MTDQQELDDIKQRLAHAMGWTPINSADSVWRATDGRVVHAFGSIADSWYLLPEMLAWLREQGCFIVLKQQWGDRWAAYDKTILDGLGRGTEGRGDTLPEAVARLVVAVAEREAKEQP